MEIFQPGTGGSGVSIITDGTNTVTGATEITFTGATVSNGGGGNAIVTISGGAGGTVTSVSVVSANGFAGTVATSTTTPAITLSTTITGLLKGDGTAISAASEGTDYQAPISLTTTGTSGAATFISNTLNIPNYTYTLPTASTSVLGGVKVDGTSITISGGVISATSGGSGTVTSVSVTTANGISGTVATATTTPAITLTLGAITPTSVNGVTFSGSGSLANSSTSSLTGFTGSGTSSGTNTGDQTITLTGDVTGSGTGSFATTLATVNTNTGSWGTATQSPQFTVNGKGLITAAANVTITPAVGSITGLATGMATFLATPSSANLAATITDETGSGALVFGTAPTISLASASTATTQSPGDGSTKIATTAYVDAAINGTDAKDACKYASTAALPSIVYANGSSGVGATLTGVALAAISLDSSSPSVGDMVLIKNQVSTFQNGIYTVTATGSGVAVFVLTRTTDFDQSADIDIGDSVFITAGTVNTNTTWVQNGTNNPVMGTDPITFSQIAGPGAITSGNGITVTGLSVAIDTSVTVDKTTAQTLTNKNLTSGTNTFPTFNQNTTGSAATLTTPRAINGVNFDGSAAITVTAAAGTLTGTTLNSTVTASSLTSVGTLGSLTVTGNITNSALTASKVVFTDGSKNLTSTGIGTSSQFIKGDGSLDSSTYITGNQTITLSGHVTGSGTTAITTSSASKFILQGTTDTTTPNAQFLGALSTGILKSTTTTGVLTIAVAADFPTLNQNTTGNAATVTTNANLTGVVTSVGNATSFGTFTSATLATALSDETGTGVAVFATSPTFTTSILAGASTANIGSTTTGWAHLYMTTGGILDFGNGNTVITHSSGILNVSTGELRITTAGTATTSVPTLTSTNTLSNKRITRRFVVTTQAAAPTINTDNTDIASITALAQAITSFTTNLSGTPLAGDYLQIQITDNGTARAITWGAKFAATTIALPTTTVISKLLRIGFQWDTVAAVWQCIAVA